MNYSEKLGLDVARKVVVAKMTVKLPNTSVRLPQILGCDVSVVGSIFLETAIGPMRYLRSSYMVDWNLGSSAILVESTIRSADSTEL